MWLRHICNGCYTTNGNVNHPWRRIFVLYHLSKNKIPKRLNVAAKEIAHIVPCVDMVSEQRDKF